MPSPLLWRSSSVCTPLYYQGEQVLSLLTWVQILRACSIVLLALGLLVLLISWLGHLPWLSVSAGAPSGCQWFCLGRSSAPAGHLWLPGATGTGLQWWR